MTDERTEGFARLREPFPPNQIGILPKPKSKDATKGKCGVCGGWHGLPAVHLDYVGHAALTDRLLEVDPEWTWEPMSVDPTGAPILDRNGGMWIRLTVLGVTRIGYGDAQGKSGANAVKEVIGDALRNAGMRFGLALDLWHKGDLHDATEQQNPPDEATQANPDPVYAAKVRLAEVVKAAGMSIPDFERWALSQRGPGLNLAATDDVKKLDALAARVKAEGSAIMGDAPAESKPPLDADTAAGFTRRITEATDCKQLDAVAADLAAWDQASHRDGLRAAWTARAAQLDGGAK